MRFDIVGLLLWTASALASNHILIFARNLDSLSVAELGSLNYDLSTAKLEFTEDSYEITPGPYCIGTRDLASKECFAYVEVNDQLGGDFVLYVDDKNEMTELSFLRSQEVGLRLRLKKVVTNIVPNLEPFQGQQQVKQPVTQRVTRKRVVENENGEKVEVEEVIEEVVPVDERSWIQKNWMYVVPPLLLLLVLSPEDKQSSN